MNEHIKLVQRGKVWVLGDNVPNDGGIMDIEMTRQIVYDPATLASHVLAAIDPDFSRHARPGDFVVAGKNFGNGPFHVQGPLGLLGLRVAVLAESTARSFYRMAVAVGLPMLPFAQGITQCAQAGDEIEMDFGSGRLINISRQTQHQFDPLPAELCAILAAGGERKWLQANVKKFLTL